jgi:ferrous iron transport protein B
MLCFTGMMAAMFYSIFALAEPLMGSIEASVEWAQTQVAEAMSPSVLRDLITDGVIAGVGNVVVFFPQICILFLFIALLEDTGYMARAAFLMDRIMSRVGLHGKSFIPLLSSHACAIPGIMATRVIESPKDRLATILVAPLMSCSARLPVYTVLIAACLPAASWIKAVTLLSMYALGVVAALSMATLFKKTLLRGPTPAFIMELPPYRLPRPGAVLRVMWDRSRLFLTRAGTVILAITIILWAAMSYPHSDQIAARYEAQREALAAVQSPDAADQLAALESQEAGEQLRQSYAGRLGHFIEPVIRPLGYDWKIGIGVIASFAAREVFVGTMGIVYSVGEADEESTPLREQMRSARWPDGSQVFTPLVAVGLMVFYVLACQCASTIAVVRRETNSWRWPLFMFSYMSALAYVGALIVYQAGSALGWGG